MAAEGVELIQTVAISVLMAAVVARELAIDVGDDSGLRRAGKIVSRYDLVAERCEGTRMLGAENSPTVAGGRVAATDGGDTGESSGQGELPAS